MTGCEKFLKILRVIGNIASTILRGLEEYREIQYQEIIKENRRRGTKYLPGPNHRRKHHRKYNKRRRHNN